MLTNGFLMEYISLILGLAIGAAIGYIISQLLKKASLVGLQVKNEELASQLSLANAELSKKNNELNEINIKSATLQAEKSSLDEKIAEYRKEQEKNSEIMKSHFENLANKIFEQKTDRFKTESEKSIKELITPLKEQLGSFQKKIDDSFNEQAKEQRSLQTHILNVIQVSEKMKVETESLTRALKGDVKAQGNWGEMILEKILEESGLRKDKDYTLQANAMGLKSDEGAATQKPDVVVNLPENKHIIIDSKVSLTHYERYCAEENIDEKNKNLNLFLNSIKEHVKILSNKHYEKNEKLNSPDFVLMFMPIEGAYSLALQKDAGLHNYAWEKKIVIVCPTTLFATLSTISSLWKIENHNKNAAEIARQAGTLHDKFIGFLEDMQDIEKNIERTSGAYKSAISKLSSGTGNIINRIKNLEALGAKTSKKLPSNFVSDEDENEKPELKIINN